MNKKSKSLIALCLLSLCLLSLCLSASAAKRLDILTQDLESAPMVAPAPVRMSESELAILARLEHELELLKETVREAQASARPGKLQFDYDQLRLDIDRIRLGIRSHRIGELTEPRAIEALSGDYR